MATPDTQPRPGGALRRALFAELRQLAQEQDGRARVYALGSTPADKTPDLYITWNHVDAVHEFHLEAGAGLAHARYDVNCWGRRLAAVEGLAEALLVHLHVRHGLIGDAEDGVQVEGIFVEGSAQAFELDAAGGWHRVKLDILVWFRERVTPRPTA